MGNEPQFDSRRKGRHTVTLTQPSPRLFEVPQEQLTSDDFYTPPWIFDRLGIRFDLDVCSPPGGVPWVPADRHYTQADDGLAQPWHGRVWMNPPYSNTPQWVARFIEHRHGIALVQVSKAKYSLHIWSVADALAVLPENISFTVTDELTGGDARYRQVFMLCWLVAFGDECVDAIRQVGPVRRIA